MRAGPALGEDAAQAATWPPSSVRSYVRRHSPGVRPCGAARKLIVEPSVASTTATPARPVIQTVPPDAKAIPVRGPALVGHGGAWMVPFWSREK